MAPLDEDDLLAAHLAHLGDIETLADLTEDQLAYLESFAQVGDEEVGCDVEVPKLTDDEWAYVIEVNGG
jgi:hypothetical protein